MRLATPRFLLLFLILASSDLDAQWTQFGGPSRDFRLEIELDPNWPPEGPPVLWRQELGDGYSGILCDDSVLYTMYRRDDKEVVVCLDADSGDILWEFDYESETTPSQRAYGGGPSSTPVIAGDALLAIGLNLRTHCLDKETGDILWAHDFQKELDCFVPGRGYSGSPCVYQDTFLVQLGGTEELLAVCDEPDRGKNEGRAFVALHQGSGNAVWSAHNYAPSMASPILIEFEGQPQWVQLTGNEIVGVDPQDGRLLWRIEHATDYGFNNTTPVFDGVDTIVCASAYSTGMRAIRLKREADAIMAEERWFSRRLRVHFTNVLFHGGGLIATTGMARSSFLQFVDLETGVALWKERGFGRANLLSVGEHILILDEEGWLAVATANREGLEIHARHRISESTTYASPTLVDSVLYVRDREHIMALDLPSGA